MESKKIEAIVATCNPLKVSCTKATFCELYPATSISVESVNVESRVPETPLNEETFQGVMNRLNSIRDDSDKYFVAIESGLVTRYEKVFEETICAVSHLEDVHIGISSALEVPQLILDHMKDKDIPHYKLMPLIRKKLKIEEANADTWGTYTGGRVSREAALREAIRNALLPLIETENLYHKTYIRLD